MNHPEEPLTLVAALGALEVQIATRLLHERLPVTQAHLCNVLHKTDKTVAKALYNLEINSICDHSNLGWSISPDGQYRLFGIRQLPEEPRAAIEPETPVDNSVNTSPMEAYPREKGRKNSDSTPLTTSSTSSIKLTTKKLKNNLLPVLDPNNKFKPESIIQPESKSEPERKLEPGQETKPKPKSKPKLKSEQRTKSSDEIEECYQTALDAGIWEDKARELAEMPHVTPELIKIHIKKVLAEKKDIPLAIYRIKLDKSSKSPRNQDPPEQKDEEWEDRQRYVTGPLAPWINH